MTLPTDVRELQNQVLGDFALNRKIVLLSILRSWVLCRLPKQQNRAEHRPVHRLPARRVQDAMERIRERGGPILAQKWSVELRVEHESAATKWWFGTELLQHQLFDWVIENPEAGADAGFASTTKSLLQESILGIRAPGHTEP